MKPNNIAMLSFSAIILMGLSGCAKYNAKPMKSLVSSQQFTKQALSFSYTAFDVDECKRYLDRDVLSKGYQPVQVTICNNTDHTFNVSRHDFNCHCIDAALVAQSVHTNTVGRAVGYGVAGLFIWPLLIPAIVDGVGSAKANEQLDADYQRKSLRPQTIKPQSTINGVIFIAAEDYEDNLAVTLTDTETNQRIRLSRTQSVVKF